MQAVRLGVGDYQVPSPIVDPGGATATGSRRRRLWELSHRLHCPVIGVCFDCEELRGTMLRLLQLPASTSDYVLHTTAVGACEHRTALAEALQRMLEQRFRRTIDRLKPIRHGAALREAWSAAIATSTDIPATLWACWTHPALDTDLEQEIYGEIHMLQHQLGSGTRADISAMHRLSRENSDLRRQLSATQTSIEAIRAEKVSAALSAERAMADIRSEAAAACATSERLARELQALHDTLPDLRHPQALLRRIAVLEIQNDAARERNATLEREVARLRDQLRDAEVLVEAQGRTTAALDEEIPERDLSGKRVLCVGGRSGSLSSYRDVVERCGGQFLHHDGGLEESAQRIDSVVAAADIVICQAGCISHNAYWRVKEHCKRTGKRCVFVKTAGVSSFGRAVEEVGD